MHQLVLFDLQISGEEIILCGWECLHNVSPLSAHVQIVNGFICDIVRSFVHNEHMRAVLMSGKHVFRSHGHLDFETFDSRLDDRFCVHFEASVVNDDWGWGCSWSCCLICSISRCFGEK